jgi:phosphatidylinositol glycan class B
MKIFLAVVFLAALVLRVGVAVYSPNIAHPDEVFQTQEPAHRLAMGPGVVSWEWREGIRSWVFPAFLAGIMRATAWMGNGSSGYVLGIIVVLSLISLTTVWFAYAWGRRASGINAALIGAGACAIWWELVWLAPKALTEVVAGHVLLIGLYLGVYGDRFAERTRMLLAGLCCGVAMSLRVHLAPAVLFAAFCFCYPNWRKRLPALAVGLLLPVAAFGVVDAATWSYPFQSFVRYAWINVVEGRSLRYGTGPWYGYGGMLLTHLGPILLLALVGVRRSPVLGGVALITVFAHSVLAHKEIRFLYPVIPIVITLAALGLSDIAAAVNARLKSQFSDMTIVAASLAFCAITSGVFAWAFPVWNISSGGLIAMDRLSEDSTVCGVGLYLVWWQNTGGYTHLNRDVPIVQIPWDSSPEREPHSFNALLAGRAFRGATGEYTLVECWNDVCLYRRAGPCVAPGDNEINSLLRRTGA